MPRKNKKSSPPPPPLPPPSRRAILLTALGVFLILIIIYHATIIPTVVDQDSGELISAAHVLGIAHPTGYPLWVLLGRAFDLLPLGGTSAYRVALASAVPTAAAAALLVVVAVMLSSRLLPSALAGLAFGLWFPVWKEAVRAEVYGLTALLVSLALLAFLRWEKDRSSRNLGLLALAVGAVSMHHRTAMLAVGPALLVAILLTQPRRLRIYLGAALLFLAPFSFYAYLPIRAAARPPVNWTDPVTLERFLDHVFARQYVGYAFSHTPHEMLDLFESLLPAFLLPHPFWAVLLGILALSPAIWGWLKWRQHKPLLAYTLLGGAALLTFWILQWGETSDLTVFFGPVGAFLALCGAIGLTDITKRTDLRWAGAIGAAICLMLLLGNWARSDESNLWQHRDRWVAMLSELDERAIFISDMDVPSFATMYLQQVEGLRPDVTLIRVVPLQMDWYVGTIDDEMLHEPIRISWAETEAGLAQYQWPSREQYNWERTALFAYLLAQRVADYRPVYVLHGSRILHLPPPPYFVGISEDLVSLRREAPQPILAEHRHREALASYPGGIHLTHFELERTDLGAGELVRFHSRWRITSRIPSPVQFAIRITPAAVDQARFQNTLLPNGRFVQAFPLLSSQWELAPLPPNHEFEQSGTLIIPTNCPVGGAEIALGIGPLYSPANTGWASVADINVKKLPPPTNPP